MQSSKKSKNKIKQWYLKYFDWNEDGVVNWWEFLIPFGFILFTEVIAEIIGLFIGKIFF
tara:strand:+ start:1412 stop:1588 length:177 start_codon:yes stop_codon:yes gene_type:complete